MIQTKKSIELILKDKVNTLLQRVKLKVSSPKPKRIEGLYRNYRYYDEKGRRLAIFAEDLDGVFTITVYTCSLKDHFHKKKIYEAYINDSKEYSPLVFTLSYTPTIHQLYSVLNSMFYRMVEESCEVVFQIFRKGDEAFILSKSNKRRDVYE